MIPARLASDTHGIESLRARAAADPRAAVQEVARQFEALFMQELMKSMRQAQQSMSAGMLDNAGSQLGTDMLDTQFATRMTGLPGGLGEAIARQLERHMGGSATPAPAAPAAAQPPAKVSQRQADFIQAHTAAARDAEVQTGIPAAFMVSQAAHETGWGRHEIRHADGSPSFNLFGIKAGPGWKGRVTETTTTEVIGGVARKVTARFRAYDSYDESFKDYARLMKNSPRYREVVAKADSAQAFAQGLQRAGYATDPSYADKLTRVINTTLRVSRSLA